jgi:hypothetical protein
MDTSNVPVFGPLFQGWWFVESKLEHLKPQARGFAVSWRTSKDFKQKVSCNLGPQDPVFCNTVSTLRWDTSFQNDTAGLESYFFHAPQGKMFRWRHVIAHSTHCLTASCSMIYNHQPMAAIIEYTNLLAPVTLLFVPCTWRKIV